MRLIEFGGQYLNPAHVACVRRPWLVVDGQRVHDTEIVITLTNGVEIAGRYESPEAARIGVVALVNAIDNELAFDRERV